ncbi:MAG: hypothetical protein ABL921_20965 [Pirellula sp.]
MKPKAVLAYCREKGIRSVDLRFVDVGGNWRHITYPISALTEASFEEGFGHSVLLDPMGTAAPIHVVLVPHSDANYLDPFTHRPTLVLIASVQDIVMRDECQLDSRYLAMRALRYLESSSVGDGLSVQTLYPFRMVRNGVAKSEVGNHANTLLACGPADVDFEMRCQIADTAAESGLQIDRHYSGLNSSSAMVLKPSNLVECCDDIMMLSYLIGQIASRNQCKVHLQDLWISSQWSITRQAESIFVGSSHRGLSDMGVHAVGGILKHSDAIAAIALSNRDSGGYPWHRICSEEIDHAICRVSVASHNPRTRTVEFVGSPASCNPYLVFSALLMAMIDGIQNKTSPGRALDPKFTPEEDVSKWKIAGEGTTGMDRKQLARRLDEDRDFLSRGEVFSDELIDLLCSRLNS